MIKCMQWEGSNDRTGREFYNVIYGHAALHGDVAHHGNHWKTKCIFDHLYQ